jgi:FdhD protein
LEPIKKISVVKYDKTFFGHKNDFVSVEEPLEIRLTYGPLDNRITRKVAITMRTPGHDEFLALGFLFNEGIIRKHADVMKVIKNTYHKSELNQNIISVYLLPTVIFDDTNLQRNFYTTSSCGICGKSSIEAIQNMCSHSVSGNMEIEPEAVLSLSEKLREKQALFDATGGIHAVALFIDQHIVAFAEDVGRHNAMDKLTGQLLASPSKNID